MPHQHYDVIIIGTGAGGGTMARALAPTGARILILERGASVPIEPENWSAEAVWTQLRYRPAEQWVDERGEAFTPYTHYNIGGNTKFWGSVLYRLRAEDFAATEHQDGISPAWPIDYATLAPYYDRAGGRLVHGAVGDHRAGAGSCRISRACAALRAAGRAARRFLSPLPLGLMTVPGGCVLCARWSFPCRIRRRRREVCCVEAGAPPNTLSRAAAIAAHRSGGAGRQAVAIPGIGQRATADQMFLPGAVVQRQLPRVASSSIRAGSQTPQAWSAHATWRTWRYAPGVGGDQRTTFRDRRDQRFLSAARDSMPLGQIQSQGRTQAAMATC